MRYLLLFSFLIHGCFCPGAFAAVTVMDGGTPKTAERVSAPNRQLSKIADKSYLIETGNGNFLVNPDFEAQPNVSYPVLPGWDLDIDASHSSQTTYLNSGSRGAQVTAASGTHTENRILFSGLITTGKDWVGQNLEAYVYIKNLTLYSGWKVCAERYSAANALESKACQDITTSDTNLRKYSINIPGGTTTAKYSIAIYKNGTVPGGSPQTVYVDNAYYGLATNIGKGVPENTFTAKVSSTGVVTDETPRDWITGSCTSANPRTCTVVGFTSSPNCTATVAQSSAYTQSINVRVLSLASIAIETGVGSAGTGATASYDAVVSCTKTGSDYIQDAITLGNTNYGPRAYTPTFTGFGTVSNVDCTEARDGVWNLIDCKFTSGTTTAVEARVSLPNSRTSPASLNSIRIAAESVLAYGASSTQVVIPLIEPSVSYITFGRQDLSGGLVKVLGTNIAGAGLTMAFKARVQINGWTETHNAPQLLGSVTSNSNNAIRVEYATFAASSAISNACTTSPCTTHKPSTVGIFTATRSGVGDYTVSWPAGAWSQVDKCDAVATTGGWASGGIMTPIAYSLNNTSVRVQFYKTYGTVQFEDVSFSIECKGPR